MGVSRGPIFTRLFFLFSLLVEGTEESVSDASDLEVVTADDDEVFIPSWFIFTALVYVSAEFVTRP